MILSFFKFSFIFIDKLDEKENLMGNFFKLIALKE
jgi:hypothetical protein